MKHVFPATALDPVRHESTDVSLPLLAGDPAALRALRGHYFVVAPVGLPDRPDPAPPSTFLAGDGMVYRVSLDGEAAVATSRIVRGPTQIAHDLAVNRPGIAPFQFFGIAIVSLPLPSALSPSAALGSRNLSNTALQPIAVDGHPAIAVTYDGGRPILVDPLTLDTVGAVGALDEVDWRGALFRDTPFPFVSATAHPAYDAATGELFLVNYRRDIVAAARDVFRPLAGPTAQDDDVPPPATRSKIEHIYRTWHDDGPDGAVHRAARRTAHTMVRPRHAATRLPLGALVSQLIQTIEREARDHETRLLRWTPAHGVQSIAVHAQGVPIEIIDSVHQMAVSEHLVVFADTRFKFDLDLVLTDAILALEPAAQRQLRAALSRAQSDRTRLYVVRRDTLDHAIRGRADHVDAVTFLLPAEVVHFMVDFDDHGGEALTVYVVHQRAMDGAEFVAVSDLTGDNRPVPMHTVGMFPMAMDLCDVTRYVLDPRQGDTVVPAAAPKDEVADETLTWALGLGATIGLGVSGARAPQRLPWSIWYSEGFVPELLTVHAYRLYRNYKGRTTTDRGGARVSLDEIKRLVAEGGRPAALFRVEHGDALTVSSRYVAEPGVWLLSPQWAPDADDPDAEGWILVTVFRDRPSDASQRDRELWVFRADDLSAPVARWDATRLGWQHTIHTAWLDALPDGRVALPPHASFRRDLAARAPADGPLRDFLDEVYGALP